MRRPSAFSSEEAEIASSLHPVVRSWRRAREASRSATATRCIPSVQRAWARNMVPNLPAPIRPTVTGRPAACRPSSMAWRFTERSEHSNPCNHYCRRAARCPAQPWRSGVDAWSRGSRRRPNRPCLRRCADDRCPGLLAHRARHENLGRTFRIVRGAALEQDLRRAFVLRLGVEAFAGLESLAAAGGSGRRLAIGGAVLRHRAALARGHDACVRQSHDRVGRILGGVAGLLAELIERRLRALQIRLEPGRALVEPMADRIDEARPENGIRRRCRRRIGGGLAWLLAWDLTRGRTSCAGADVTRQSAPAASTAHAMAAKERASSVSGWLVISIPSDVTAARRLGGTRGKNEERRNFKTDRGRQ